MLIIEERAGYVSTYPLGAYDIRKRPDLVRYKLTLTGPYRFPAVWSDIKTAKKHAFIDEEEGP